MGIVGNNSHTSIRSSAPNIQPFTNNQQIWLVLSHS
jgi:hypothetical protein